MIDIHCHILPVDDGAKDILEAIEMAKIAQADGIKTIINTAHFNPDFEYIYGNELKIELENFNKRLKEENIDIEVIIGNELYYNESLLQHLGNENVEFHTLANSDYTLVEFSPTNFPKNILDVVYEFKIRGYKIIIAHIERYKEIQDNPQLAKQLIEEGAYIQVNASSVLKKGPTVSNKLCEYLLENNLVHLIGSDGHGASKRRPTLKETYDYVENTYGKNNAEKLFIKNPKAIIENDVLINMETEVKIKKNFILKLIEKCKKM